MQKLLTFFFSKIISVYAIFNGLSFNDTLTNDIVSFEQLGPEYYVAIKDVSACFHEGIYTVWTVTVFGIQMGYSFVSIIL